MLYELLLSKIVSTNQILYPVCRHSLIEAPSRCSFRCSGGESPPPLFPESSHEFNPGREFIITYSKSCLNTRKTKISYAATPLQSNVYQKTGKIFVVNMSKLKLQLGVVTFVMHYCSLQFKLQQLRIVLKKCF